MEPVSVATYKILKLASPGDQNNSFTTRQSDDLLAIEQPLEIRIAYGPENARKQKNISVTMCTPGNDEELAAGFLFTEGIIGKKEEIRQTDHTGNSSGSEENIITVELDPKIPFNPDKIERHFYTTSSCGVCGKSSLAAVKNISVFPLGKDNIRVQASLLTLLPECLRKKQEVFEQTGGLHASALFDAAGNLLLTREDVGRHNALDKLIGASLMSETLPLNRHILLLSGRASFELVQKAAMAGIKIVCAVGAPSSLAVELAKEFDMTLVGFLRDRRFNIYSGEQRIIR